MKSKHKKAKGLKYGHYQKQFIFSQLHFDPTVSSTFSSIRKRHINQLISHM